MKRVVEAIFTLIGILMYGLLTIVSIAIFSNFKENPESKNLIQEFLTDENIKEVNADQVLSLLSNGTIFILVISVLCIVFGILSLFTLKGDRDPKLAGKILILTSILGTILTLFTGILGGLPYLIAGIIALVRKSKLRDDNNLIEEF